MRDDKYVSVMLAGISDAAERKLLSPSGEKRLVDNVMDNKKADIIAACFIEAGWDIDDSIDWLIRGINYYDS